MTTFRELIFSKPELESLIMDACNWATMMQRWRRRGLPGCDVCGNRMLAPMLEHDLWNTVRKHHREVLCEECIDHRLERKLQEWDLLPCLWNRYRMAFLIVSKMVLP